MAYNSKYTGAEVENLLGKIDNKQDTISDLDEIRRGAAKGTTAATTAYVNQAIANAITNTLNTPV